MTKPLLQSALDVEAFAECYGLVKLTKDHLARMQALAPVAANLGGTLPRPASKSDAPAPRFTVIPVSKQ